MIVRASDERAHEPGDDPWWWETWHLDVVTDVGIGLMVRLACAPKLGVAWWWTHLVLPDLQGPIVVRDHEVPLPRQGLEVHADGLWGELMCQTPFEHWTYGLEAFGLRLDEPIDSLRGEIGERVPVGLDLEWEVDDAVEHYEFRRGGEQGYEQFGFVHGEVLVGRSRFEITGAGPRSHSWGSPSFDRPARAMWLRSNHLSMSFAASDPRYADGYVAIEGVPPEPMTTVRSELRRRADGLPEAARDVVDHYEIDAEVAGLVAIPVVGRDGESAVLARAFCNYRMIDGFGSRDRGIGWSSWLDPASNDA